jgi:hypothetical protein
VILMTSLFKAVAAIPHSSSSKTQHYRTMRRLPALLITLLLATPAFAVELFRYRGAAKDGGTLEYVFKAGEQNSPNAITKEKAAEIAADLRLRNFVLPRPRSGSSAFRTRSRGRCDKCSLSCFCRMGPLLCRAWRNGCSMSSW